MDSCDLAGDRGGVTKPHLPARCQVKVEAQRHIAGRAQHIDVERLALEETRCAEHGCRAVACFSGNPRSRKPGRECRGEQGSGSPRYKEATGAQGAFSEKMRPARCRQ